MNGIYTQDGVIQKDELWTKYRHIVRNEALRLQVKLPASVELDDLIQAGTICLLGAIDQFDPKKGVGLGAYVTQRIRWAMIDELREYDWVPRRVRSNSREISAAIRKIEQEGGAPASEASVAEMLGVSLHDYQQMLLDTNNSQVYSLDELQEEFADNVQIVDQQSENNNPLNELMRGKLVQKIGQEIKFLPEREQLLLSLYYQQELNMKEIGVLLGITETRVSQLHSLAIKRLRARLDVAGEKR